MEKRPDGEDWNPERALAYLKSFIDEVGSLVGPIDTGELATNIARLAVAADQDPESLYKHFAPHHLSWILEIHSSRHTKAGPNQDDEEQFRQALNLCGAFYDPYQRKVLVNEKRIDLMMRAMAHVQFPFQRRPADRYLERSSDLYTDPRLGAFTDQFTLTHGSSPSTWVFAGATFLARASERPGLVMSDPRTPDVLQGNFPSLELFAQKLGWDRTQLGKHFDERLEKAGFSAMSARTPFMRRPLFQLAPRVVVLPFPNLMLPAVVEYIHQWFHSCKTAGHFGNQFGDVFEDVVGKYVGRAPNLVKLLGESELAGQRDEPSCDYLGVWNDCAILVECKAISYTPDFASENAFVKSTACKRIYQEAIPQLVTTAAALREGRLLVPGVTQGTPIYGIVVTNGEVDFANHPNHIESLLKPGLEQAGAGLAEKLNHFANVPQVLSLDSLQRVLALCQKHGLSLLAPLLAHQTSNYYKVGDWSTFIGSWAKNLDSTDAT